VVDKMLEYLHTGDYHITSTSLSSGIGYGPAYHLAVWRAGHKYLIDGLTLLAAKYYAAALDEKQTLCLEAFGHMLDLSHQPYKPDLTIFSSLVRFVQPSLRAYMQNKGFLEILDRYPAFGLSLLSAVTDEDGADTELERRLLLLQ